MAEDDSSKTEQPTAKRLAEAREEGNFAKAPDLQLVAVLVASLWVFSVFGRGLAERCASIAVGILGHLGKFTLRPEAALPWGQEAATVMLGLIIPIAGACAFAGSLLGGVQSGFKLTPKVLGFKFDRIDPSNGFKRIFSTNGLVRVGLELLRLAAVAWVIWGGLRKIMDDPIFMTPVPLPRLGSFIAESTGILLWRCILALGCIAAINYTYQAARVSKQLMMTKQEVKDENKQTEGDPKIKSALRALARRILQRQMMQAVPTADVIVTNPTHFAVALRYDRDNDAAPVVVAKGEQAFARRLKALAAEHGVPMVENPPVARMLYKFGKVGKPIPAQMYQAVAEILAFVYRTHREYFRDLKGRRKQSEARPG